MTPPDRYPWILTAVRSLLEKVRAGGCQGDGFVNVNYSADVR